MSFRFDATVKEMVRLTMADYSAHFQLSQNPTAQLLNVDLSTLSAATDTALGFGDPLELIADLNFQSGADAYLPERGLLYNSVLRSRFHVPVHTVFILLKKEADHPNLTGIMSYGDERHRVEFRYGVVRLWQQPAESYLNAELGIVPLAVLGQLPTDRPVEESLLEIASRIEARLKAETSREVAVKLMTAAYVLTGLRVDREISRRIYQGVDLMSETTAFEAVEDVGAIKHGRKMILRQGRSRFGPADSATEAAVNAVDDLDRLDRMADAVLTAKSWRELLATA